MAFSELAGELATQIVRSVQKQCKVQEAEEAAGDRYCTQGLTQTALVRGVFGGNIHCSKDIVIGASLDVNSDQCCTASALGKAVLDTVIRTTIHKPNKAIELLNDLLGTSFDPDKDVEIITRRQYDRIQLAITSVCGTGGGVMQASTLTDMLIANSNIKCGTLRAAINESESIATCIMGNGGATQKLKQPESFQELEKRYGLTSQDEGGVTEAAIITAATVLGVFGVALIVMFAMRRRAASLELRRGTTGEIATVDAAANMQLGL